MKRYKLAIDFDCRDMEAVARPAADGEYARYEDVQKLLESHTRLAEALNQLMEYCETMTPTFKFVKATEALNTAKQIQ